MLYVDPYSFDIAPVLAHYAEHGYARLGRVLGEEALHALRERADDLMLGRVSYPYQLDSQDGGRGHPLPAQEEDPAHLHPRVQVREVKPGFTRGAPASWVQDLLDSALAVV